MLALASHNSELRFFFMSDSPLRVADAVTATGAAMEGCKQRLSIAIQRLRLRAPHYNSEPVTTFVERLIDPKY